MTTTERRKPIAKSAPRELASTTTTTLSSRLSSTLRALLTSSASILTTTAFLLCATSAHANGAMDTFGVDARSRAMAGTQVTAATSGAAVHVNPAALAPVEDVEVHGGFSLMVPQLSVETANSLPDDSSISPVLPPSRGGYHLVFTIPFAGVLKDWVSFGGAFYFPALVLTHVRSHDPVRPFVYMYDTNTDHYEADLGASFSFFGYGSVGAGVRLGAGQRGYIRADLDPLTQEITDQRIDAFQYTIVAPVVGAMLGPIGPKFLNARIGAAYRGALSTPMTVPAFVGVDGLDVNIFAPVSAEANFSPAAISVGGSIDASAAPLGDVGALVGALTLAVDVQYLFWSAAPSPHVSVATDVYGDDVDALGLGGALNTPADGTNRVQQPGFQDTMVVRVGAEARPLNENVKLRAGYFYRPTPVPDQTSGTNILDATAHGVTGGVGFEFSASPLVDGLLFVDVSWQSHILSTRTVAKARSDDPIGGTTLSGMIHESSVSIGYRFQ